LEHIDPADSYENDDTEAWRRNSLIYLRSFDHGMYQKVGMLRRERVHGRSSIALGRLNKRNKAKLEKTTPSMSIKEAA